MPDTRHMNTPTLIISDIHLGSEHCRLELFLRFLDCLPPGAALVINGDLADRWHAPLEGRHAEAFQRLRAEARQRPVIWVRGNHDLYFDGDPGQIQMTESHAIGRQLLVIHGHTFDRLHGHKHLATALKKILRFRMWIGAESVHAAHYAKRFELLYDLFCRSVRHRAIAHARAEGFHAVTCGHTHRAEDSVVKGVRYLNTGCWTETPVRSITVTAQAVELRIVDAVTRDPPA
jgi:UDP-2,3-diacylglucosamine pyrophosphatase LpxH